MSKPELGESSTQDPSQPDPEGVRDNKGDQAHDVPFDNSKAPWSLDPQDFLPSPPKPLGPLSSNPSSSALRPVFFLVGLWFLASVLHWTKSGFDGWVSRKAVFQDGEYWRLVTALFVHSDLGHLLSNLPLFFVFGFYLNGFFGFWIFPLAALVAGVIANLATLAMYQPETRLVGASGMLYAMVAMWLVLYLRFERGIPWSKRLLRSIGVGLVLLFPTSFQPTTSYAAHGFGFLAGAMIAGVLIPLIKHWPRLQYPAPQPELH